jgi:hypothetical protein
MFVSLIALSSRRQSTVLRGTEEALPSAPHFYPQGTPPCKAARRLRIKAQPWLRIPVYLSQEPA